MRRFFMLPMAVLAATLVLALGSLALAQTARHGGRFGHRPGCWMARIGNALNLTEAQRAQAQKIIKDAMQRAKQVLTPEQQQQATAQLRRFHQGGGFLRELKLTPDQWAKIKELHAALRVKITALRENAGLSDLDRQAQLRDLRRATRDQITQLLTPEQQAKLTEMKAKMRDAIKQLNLTPEQRAQLLAIRDETLGKVRAMLTPEQQTKLDQFLAQHPLCGTQTAK